MKVDAKIILEETTTADATSAVVDVQQSYCYSIQYSFVGGTPAGSLQLQISNDGVIWTNKGSSIAISAAGNGMIEADGVGYAYARVFFDYTSGTSAMKLTSFKKG